MTDPGRDPAQLIGRPSITVVVAAYNAETTLSRAIESVFRQSVQNWSLVIVDDGSFDETAVIAARYAERDSRVQILSQPNRGAAAARNTALAFADSDFVTYLDADDELAPSHMTTMLDLVANSPGFDIYSSDGMFVHPDGSMTPVFGYEEVQSLVLEDMLGACRILGGGALVRTGTMRALGGFREHIYGEDYDLWLRALAAGALHIATPDALYFYHQGVYGQKSEDTAAGTDSAVNALEDLCLSGLLSPEQVRAARVGIARFTLDRNMNLQETRVTNVLVRILGHSNANKLTGILRRCSWAVRPIRRAIARRNRGTR